MRLAIVAVCSSLLVVTGCLDAASRTQRIPPSGKCEEAELFKAGEPGDECVVAEDCSAFCCECAGPGEFEAQLCLGGACADAATTCDDAATDAEICR